MKQNRRHLHVKLRLFKQLLEQSRSTMILGQMVATIVLFGLWGQVNQKGLLVWYSLLTVATVGRLLIHHFLKKRVGSSDIQNNIRRYLIFYSAGTMIAGITWASLLLLYESSLSSDIQTFILVITIGMPMAALSTNAILPCVFYTFTLPSLIGVSTWALIQSDTIGYKFLLVSLIYSILVIITGKRFHLNLRTSIENGLENHRLVEELRELAYVDHLTELPNRRQFQISTERTLARIKRSGGSMALMLIDVDNFKYVNDTFGHEAGDELLMALSRRIRHTIRLGDLLTQEQSDVARLGGDEFIVMLECEHEKIEVAPAAERILHNLTASLTVGNVEYIPGVSIGIAISPRHATDMKTLMSCADQAMYCAKQKGGNAYSIFDHDADTTHSEPGIEACAV